LFDCIGIVNGPALMDSRGGWEGTSSPGMCSSCLQSTWLEYEIASSFHGSKPPADAHVDFIPETLCCNIFCSVTI